MMADGENFEDWCAFVCGSSEKRNLPTMSAPQLSTVCPDGERSATLATWAAAALLPWPRPRGHLGGSPQGKRRCGAAPAAHGARLLQQTDRVGRDPKVHGSINGGWKHNRRLC